MAYIRLNVDLPDELVEFLVYSAAEENVTLQEMLRRTLSAIFAFDKERKLGRTHMGCVEDPSRLDSELVGLVLADLLPNLPGLPLPEGIREFEEIIRV